MNQKIVLSFLFIASLSINANSKLNFGTQKNHRLTFAGIAFSTREPIEHDQISRAMQNLTGQPWQIMALDRKLTRASLLQPELDYLAFTTKQSLFSIGQAWQLAHDLEKHFNPNFFDYLEPSFESLEAIKNSETDLKIFRSFFSAKTPTTQQFYEWHLEQLAVRQAWSYSLTCSQQAKGDGVKIAHPDSGYVVHPEFGPQEKIIPVFDYTENDNDPQIKPTEKNLWNQGGPHGLATGCIINSRPEEDQTKPHVTGVAPEATLYVYRVTAPGDLLPAPILLNSNMNKLASAILDAIDKDCHILSISLGGLKNIAVQRAIKKAVASGIIVICAAGNKVMTVVYPALDHNAIAVAANNFDQQPWEFSSRGSKVDFCAPGQDVFTAQLNENTGAPEVTCMSGTSFATANTAGLAALWLAHHGRKKLIAKYGKHNLNEVFRHMGKLTAAQHPLKFAEKSSNEFGAGIIHALDLLQMPLPSYTELEQLKVVCNLATWQKKQLISESIFYNGIIFSLKNNFLTQAEMVSISVGFLKAMQVLFGKEIVATKSLLQELCFNFETDTFLPFLLQQQTALYRQIASQKTFASIKNLILQNKTLLANLRQICGNLLNNPISRSLQQKLTPSAARNIFSEEALLKL